MIISLKEILENARSNKVAVPAFNIGNKDIFDMILEAAEEMDQPTIIEVSVPECNFLGFEFLKWCKEQMEQSAIPFVLHLDHGKDPHFIREAIENGFNSVMIDASSKSFEENVRITQTVVEYAHMKGVCVESELGTIGNTESSSYDSGLDTEIIYTDPASAKDFCEQTGTDALAIAIGTSHGMYPHGNTPKLRIDILEEIAKTVETPLVLHGGSGNDDEEIKKAIQAGISKINISSEVKEAYFKAMKSFMEEHPKEVKTQTIQTYAKQAAKEMICKKINLMNRR